MPVDPQIAAILALMEQLGAPALSEGTPEQARAGMRAMTIDMRDAASLAVVRSIEDSTLPGPAGDIAIRVYRPEADGPVPTVVFFHGGGFVIGDIETHDDQARLLSRDVAAVVVSIDYRLAPENKFPAGFEDCLAATTYVGAHIDDFGGDSARLAVAGDSAGGNLAAAVAVACRDAGGPALAAQLLLYPVVDLTADGPYPSRVDNGEGYFLTADDSAWFHLQYVPDDFDDADPRASVIKIADLSGLPPAVIGTAEFDPLRDEGEAYAERLREAGVEVVLHRFDGMIHGFYGMGAISPAAAEAVRTLNADLRAQLDTDLRAQLD
jgi:acetyl esterase